jgi:hypothetical protein
VTLHVSSDRGKSFLPAHFPYQLSERSYRVVDSKEVVLTHTQRARAHTHTHTHTKTSMDHATPCMSKL